MKNGLLGVLVLVAVGLAGCSGADRDSANAPPHSPERLPARPIDAILPSGLPDEPQPLMPTDAGFPDPPVCPAQDVCAKSKSECPDLSARGGWCDVAKRCVFCQF